MTEFGDETGRKIRFGSLLIVAAVVGVLVSFIAYSAIKSIENHTLEMAFRADMTQLVGSINWQLKSNLDTLEFFKKFYAGSEHVTAREFAVLGDSLLQHYPSMRAFAWVPRLSHEPGAVSPPGEHDEATAAAFGASPATDTQLSARYPVSYLAGNEAVEALRGYDLASSSAFMAAVQGLEKHTKIQFVEDYSDLPTLVPGQDLLVVTPVFQKNQTEPQLMGVVLGVFRLTQVIEQVVAEAAPEQARLRLVALQANGDERLLFGEHLPVELISKSPVVYRRSLMPLGSWQVSLEAIPQRAFFRERKHLLAEVFLTGGLLFTGLMCIYLVTLARHSREIQQVVEKKTHELHLANEKLELLSLTDGLTGVVNRRGFDRALEREWLRSVRNATPMTLLLFDVDYFKAYNDFYGHVAGDECLRRVAAAIAGVPSRPGDMVARYGGEEFALLMPGSEDPDLVVAHKCRDAVKALGIRHEASPVAPVVTVSIGAASLYPKPHMAWDELICAADEALYRAKSTGRDQVCQTLQGKDAR